MKKVLILVTLVFLLIVGFFVYWNSQLSPVSSEGQTKDVVVAKGLSLSQISDQLKKEGLIKSSLIFQLYVRSRGLGSSLQAGMFKLSPSMTTAEIIKTLMSGPEGIWVRFVEGWRIEEYAQELNKQLKIDQKEFLNRAEEGYMFPDSYLFPREATAEYVTDTLRKTFDIKVTDDLSSKIISHGLTEKEGIILASIVEREARSDKARQDVASILLKRLKIGMGINADATIQYILGYQTDEKSWWKRNLSHDDLKIESLYNTYIYKGLPPAPICNPSLSSIEAVANADPTTDYLYYYHDSKGIPHFGKTLEEHNNNISTYP